MNFLAIIQARIASKRLPKKVIKKLNGVPLIIYMVERLRKSKYIDQIIIATTTEQSDNVLERILQSNGIKIFRGQTSDVLARFYGVSQEFKSKNYLRLTADCPFIDYELIDKGIEIFSKNNFDYLSNNHPPTFPDGLDFEIFTQKTLEECFIKSKSNYEKEHVTPWMVENINNKYTLKSESDYSYHRWTVDELEDYQLAEKIADNFSNEKYFSWIQILDYVNKNSNLKDINANISRNEGSLMSSGEKVWRRAKKAIAGGNSLLSKRPDMFLTEKWPSYFSRTKGINIWDLDGNKFIDMTLMGVGTNILGYSNPEVDEAVKQVVEKGNLSTLNCSEEVDLAEKLIDMHPWADKVRFARTGGEANSVAIRIARAATGREKVAICGYHGWHDWYLATNLVSDNALNKHLLPGLKTDGVPESLKNTIFPFSFNNFDEILKIADKEDLACIKMEVQRSKKPDNDFLRKIRELCDKKGIVLIFDECTSGFRETFGGIHLKYKIFPDMAVFGKTLGNGYAITSILGKDNVMEAVNNSFISSTFWTERIGPTAAIKTLEVMEKVKSWEVITDLGSYLQNGWKRLADNHKLEIELGELPALANFNFKKENIACKTFITQEMLKYNFLASTACYLSIEHKTNIIDEYLEKLDIVFEKIKDCEREKKVEDLLDGNLCSSGFQRLT